ncbi:MAG: MBL fold metallo-hydrolase [Bacteroidetes bacterium]|nr:MBL fold metallo-hydrolase [Bacteroidota bacterium]
MFIKQLYTSCLSEAAYYLECEGEAAIIDPLRDIDQYLQLAQERRATIKYIFETHFHADFVSGHIDLSKATGAPIIFGPGTEAAFDFHAAQHGETFSLGNCMLKVLHTPGHTMESTCYLLLDENGKPKAVFTGDTLFVGGVGRPDLAQGVFELTTNDLAALLYDSIQQQLMHLPDDVVVYPAHGPGSSCGKNISNKTVSTIGDEKLSNVALKAGTKEDFIRIVTEGIQAPPLYFPINATLNKKGYISLEKIFEKGLHPLDANEFAQIMEDQETIILDSRPAAFFSEGFIPGSIGIGLDGRFAEWSGSLIPFDKNILLVAEQGKELETVTRLARVGFDKMTGFLDGGFETWKDAGKPVDMIISIDPDELAMDIQFDPKLYVLDVRNAIEFGDGHIKDAIHFPLSDMTDLGKMADIDETDNIYIHCAGGYRSVIACSLLKRQGIHNIRNVNEGWSGIKKQDKIEQEKNKEILN